MDSENADGGVTHQLVGISQRTGHQALQAGMVHRGQRSQRLHPHPVVPMTKGPLQRRRHVRAPRLAEHQHQIADDVPAWIPHALHDRLGTPICNLSQDVDEGAPPRRLVGLRQQVDQHVHRPRTQRL